jgi:hypothetical protein
VSHRHAALTPRARLGTAWLIVDQGWPAAQAAAHYDMSWGPRTRCGQALRELAVEDGSSARPRPSTA